MLLCVGGTDFKWRLRRDGQSGSQCCHLRWPLAFLQWLTGGGSLQWLLCLSSLVQLGAIPWLPEHWQHKLWALLALGYQLKPAWSKKTGSQYCWVSSLLGSGRLEVLVWEQLAVLSEEGPGCRVCFAASYSRRFPCSSLCTQWTFGAPCQRFSQYREWLWCSRFVWYQG